MSMSVTWHLTTQQSVRKSSQNREFSHLKTHVKHVTHLNCLTCIHVDYTSTCPRVANIPLWVSSHSVLAPCWQFFDEGFPSRSTLPPTAQRAMAIVAWAHSALTRTKTRQVTCVFTCWNSLLSGYRPRSTSKQGGNALAWLGTVHLSVC